MANNYRQFCFGLALRSKAEADWFRKTLQEAKAAEDPNWGGTMHDFEATVYEDGSLRHIVFQDNGESGNVEQIADIVERFLKLFRIDGYMLMEWSDTCSKHRLGEFGGGTAVVTAKGTHWLNASEWVKRKTKGLTNAGLL